MSLADRLAELVSFDTQNPTGRERPLCDKLAADLRGLGAAAVEVTDVGDHAYVYARFGGGAPRLLLNVHVDTVPANSGYGTPPLEMIARGGRLFGLGTADTKGAIAAILEALARRPPARPVAVLFSGDEEKGASCMRAFLQAARDGGPGRELEQAIVCEPTGCRVGSRHRGIGAAAATARGPGGHSSRVDELPNPIAILAHAAVALDQLGRERRAQGPVDFRGICLNVAAIDGGIAFNVIPTRASLLLSVRPAPGAAVTEVLAEAERRVRAATAPHEVEWEIKTANPAFQTRDVAAFEALLGAPARAPIDLAFWTEAALLSEAGINAVVFGPGDIAQAHGADEFVELAQLEAAQAAFERVLSS
jgi:acetylornithine deacetylase